MDPISIKCKSEIKSEQNLDGGTADEANNLLGNGILVETNKG